MILTKYFLSLFICLHTHQNTRMKCRQMASCENISFHTGLSQNLPNTPLFFRQTLLYQSICSLVKRWSCAAFFYEGTFSIFKIACSIRIKTAWVTSVRKTYVPLICLISPLKFCSYLSQMLCHLGIQNYKVLVVPYKAPRWQFRKSTTR